MALAPRFQLHLPEKVLTGRLALGRFDGSTTSIAFATAAGKVFLHNPQDGGGSGGGAAAPAARQPRLNINKQISVLAAGPLLPNSVRDVLLVGTPTCLHCYDVEHNRDLFYKDVPEGVSCIAVGSFGAASAAIAVVGGAGALQGFDSSGREVFWTAVGGGVTALALADVDEDGCNELLVGCDDACIRVYKDEELVQQLGEADAVVGLTGLGQGRKWAYALANGTIGVYDGGVRLWRVKSKHSVTSLVAFDLLGGSSAPAAAAAHNSSSSSSAPNAATTSTSTTGTSSMPQLISGWSSGRVEARSGSTGEVVARDTLGSGVAALLRGMLREADAADLELLAVSTEGEVRGYLPHHEELVADVGGDVSLQQRMLVDLAQKKQQLIYELASYQTAAGSSGGSAAPVDGSGSGSTAAAFGGIGALAGGLASSLGSSLGGGSSGGASGAGAVAADRGHIASMIPPDTRVDSAITINKATHMCELVLKTNNDTVVHAALIFGEQVFDGESLLVAPPQPSGTLAVPIAPRRDVPVLLLMKVLVGSRASSVYHVFELDLEMPKFALYAAEERPPPGGIPASHVCFELQHPAIRVAAWLKARFGSRAQLAAARSGSGRSSGGGTLGEQQQQQQQQQLMAHFTCLRTNQPLAVRAAPGSAGSLTVWLHSESIALAGELLQDLAARLGVTELTSTASFPAAMAAFRDTIAQVEAASAARAMVDTQAAVAAADIKAAVVRAEDARLLRDVAGLRRAHKRLADLNRDMWLDHARRVSNQQQLLDGLKAVNAMIQAAAGLRLGAAQGRVVAACRAAIKANNLQALERVVCSGA